MGVQWGPETATLNGRVIATAIGQDQQREDPASGTFHSLLMFNPAGQFQKTVSTGRKALQQKKTCLFRPAAAKHVPQTGAADTYT